MKSKMMILMSVIAVIFLAAAMISVAGDDNSSHSGASSVSSPQPNISAYQGYGPCGNSASMMGGRGMFNGRRDTSGGWKWYCPGSWFQNTPQGNSGQYK